MSAAELLHYSKFSKMLPMWARKPTCRNFTRKITGHIRNVLRFFFLLKFGGKLLSYFENVFVFPKIELIFLEKTCQKFVKKF